MVLHIVGTTSVTHAEHVMGTGVCQEKRVARQVEIVRL
jgi:hypothetical protein